MFHEGRFPVPSTTYGRKARGFTLMETLLATSFIGLGLSLIWDGYLSDRKHRQRIEGTEALLTDLVKLSEALSRDSEWATRFDISPNSGQGEGLDLIGDGGTVTYRVTRNGLERADLKSRILFPSIPSCRFQALVVGTQTHLLVEFQPGRKRPGDLLRWVRGFPRWGHPGGRGSG